MTTPFTLGLHEIGADTYAYLQPNGTWGYSNAGLVVSGDQALLVDTLFDVPMTRTMLEVIAQALPGVTINTVVNTHSDGDHWWGNELVADATIIASEAAAKVMREENLLDLLNTPPASFQVPPIVNHMSETFDFKSITPTPPNRSFSGELEVAVGERTVRLIEVGPAHTPGDVLIHVPDAGVVYTGDILFIGGHPVIHTGPIARWIDACNLILDLNADTIVPGHGPVIGKAEVRAFRDYLERLRDHAVRSHRAGLTAMQAAQTLDMAGFANWDDPDRIVLNIGAVYRELDNEPHEAHSEMALMGCMHTYTATTTYPAPTEPRIAPRSRAEMAALSTRLEGIPAKLLADDGDSPLAGRPVLNVLATIGNNPDLMVALAPLLAQLAMGEIPGRERELAILRVAHRTGSAYEWEHHIRIGAAAGLTEAEIARVPLDVNEADWSDADRALLRAVDELVADQIVSAITWQGLAAHYSTAQLIELLALVGTYTTIAGILKTCRVQLDDWVTEPATGNAA
ncbi:MBL fold metallo-hydrolase [Streptomyces catenulae]|uniref:MBL fold metallo-hydrolase n=1 Tax=Streptomyces catenulae TaxID=66875 RepID=A0ABV2Z2C5_9ACTN|nr:MBL fold metallo-hydrolase [Streptomyces catenulae]